MKLSIIIPVFNEEKSIAKTLQDVLSVSIPNVILEIIIVNDGSTDQTESRITNHESRGKKKNIQIITHKKNCGKGAAVKTGIQNASGDYIIIQDADSEYNPQDIPNLLKSILEKRAQVVYGTRLKRLPHFHGEEKTSQFFVHYIGNKFLNVITSLLYGQWITDMETGYKLFPRKSVLSMQIFAKGFEIEPEITAKLLKGGYKIVEIPIVAIPRGYKDGKKLHTFRDGFKALFYLVKYRFRD